MTLDISLVQNLTTKSGKPITLGTGSGTKWQWQKRGRSEDVQHLLHQDLVDSLLLAIKNGYNHLDTAEVYNTQLEVAEAIKLSGVKREDLFITTKYTPGFVGNPAPSASPKEFLEKALVELNTNYIDLLLIHSPFFSAELSRGQTLSSAWDQLIDLKKAGKVRYIGVSNFTQSHLQQVIDQSESPEFWPVVNQIEFNPYLQNQSPNIQKFAREHNILLEAYGPLTPLFRIEKDGQTVDHPLKHLLPKLSEKYDKTPAQILLRYTLQKGLLPITTSSKEERIKEALDVYNFTLSKDDVELIDSEGSTFHSRNFFIAAFEPKKEPAAETKSKAPVPVK